MTEANMGRIPLLRGVDIEHGPRDKLGTLFLKATDAARARGLRLYLTSLGDVLEVNEANRDSWGPLAPMYNSRLWGPDDDNAFGIVGIDDSGATVATHAVRLYRLGERTIAEEAQSMRLFYRDPGSQQRPGEHCRVTAPTAGELSGTIAFSG